MTTDPHKVLRDAVIEAQRILAQHVEPSGPNCERTISRLLGVMDGPAVRRALATTAAA
jgi:hypothetical protein